MDVRREKLSGGHVDQSAGVLGIVTGALFLRSSRIRPTSLTQRQRLPCMGTARMKHMGGVRGLLMKSIHVVLIKFPLQGVHRFESPRLLDMSNHLFASTIK
jgi:hypothetical protein